MTEYILVLLLFFSLFYLLSTSLVLIRNRFDLTELAEPEITSKSAPKISVCIPARNEESVIGNLLNSVLNQDWHPFDVHVLDDQSEDNTLAILESYQDKFPDRMFIHHGQPRPDNWLGKPWACHQLSELCDGEILLFLDADTTLNQKSLQRIKASLEHYNLDMLTVWPRQILNTFWEKTVIPLIYYALVTLLPAIYVYRHPRWMPSFLQKIFAPKFAAACGQCIAFTREAYNKINGHKSVKNEVVEDVELAKNIKKRGLTMRMFHGIGAISCRMYEGEKEMFDGLRKNFLAGFNNSLPVFITAALLHLLVFVLPFFTLIAAFLVGNIAMLYLSVASIGLILLHRLILSVWFRWDPLYSFTHPLGVLWFQRLGIIKVIDFVKGRKSSWKGRDV